MIMTLDPSTPGILKGDDTENVMTELLGLEEELHTVLTKEEMTIGQLFKKVAIRSSLLTYKRD